MSDTGIIQFDAPKAIDAVKVKVAQYKDLSIKDMSDKEGYEKVRVAISDCVSTRTEFVKNCKEAREESTRYSKFVIEQEKIGVDEIEKIEKALKAEKEKIDSEKERIKAEKERVEQAKVQIRVDELAKYGYTHDLFDLRHMSVEEYLSLKNAKGEEFVFADKLRQEREQAEKKEREDFEKKKAEQEAREKEFADREAAIKSAEDKIKAEQDAKIRAEELERVQKDAAEKARIETEKRIKEEQEAARIEAAKIEELRKEQEREEKAAVEKKARYIKFLKSHGYTSENKHEFEVETLPDRYILKRILGEFKL